MESLAPVFFVVGFSLCFVAFLWSVVFAFRVHPLLGVLSLIGPIVSLVVVVRHWPESRRPVALWVFGALSLLLGVLLSPTSGASR